MELFRFWYSKIKKREYPLIVIPKKKPTYLVPYASNFPYRVSLVFSKQKMEEFKITEDNIDEVTAGILEHEYVHIVLWMLGEIGASSRLNDVNGWHIKTSRVIWRMNDNGQKVWETVNGDRI